MRDIYASANDVFPIESHLDLELLEVLKSVDGLFEVRLECCCQDLAPKGELHCYGTNAPQGFGQETQIPTSRPS